MTFDERHAPRFKNVIEPAISGIRVNQEPLKARRVDESKSGDSILTEIVDGIAHARMVLADVSVLGNDAITKTPYRNGNVMYEVGIALASRRPSDVLLVRDDQERFLFDVSTIPHMTIDFSMEAEARSALQSELIARLREQEFSNDARVQLAAESLTNQEIVMLTELLHLPAGESRGWKFNSNILTTHEMALARLTEKHLIRITGFLEKEQPAYQLTPIGRVVAERVIKGLAKQARQQQIGGASEGLARS